MPIRLDEIPGVDGETPQPQASVPTPQPAFTPFPGMELQGVTVGKQPSFRYGPSKPQPVVKDPTEKSALETSRKLTQAIRRLAVINQQFEEAFPSGERTPFEQRIAGSVESIGAKTGVKPNPQLLALQSNIRPLAINLIRLFGEVGNLSESEQKGAIDVVNQTGLTSVERKAKLKQFAEFALAGAEPAILEKTLRDNPDLQKVVQDFGIRTSLTQPSVGMTPSGLRYTIEE